MTITVTGATGHLGRLVVDALKRRGAGVVAAVRDTSKDLGVPARLADYDRPETLVPAFEGTDRLLLISGNEAGRRSRSTGPSLTPPCRPGSATSSTPASPGRTPRPTRSRPSTRRPRS